MAAVPPLPAANGVSFAASCAHRCRLPTFEPIFTSILGGMVAEGRVPAGSVLDAGAHTGNLVCYLGRLMHMNGTIFFAVEPLRRLFVELTSRYGACGGVVLARLGLGERATRLDPGSAAAAWDSVGDGLVGLTSEAIQGQDVLHTKERKIVTL